MIILSCYYSNNNILSESIVPQLGKANLEFESRYSQISLF